MQHDIRFEHLPATVTVRYRLDLASGVMITAQAGRTHQALHTAMRFDNVRAACPLVQAVNVLGHHRDGLVRCSQLSQQTMSGIRACASGRTERKKRAESRPECRRVLLEKTEGERIGTAWLPDLACGGRTNIGNTRFGTETGSGEHQQVPASTPLRGQLVNDIRQGNCFDYERARILP